MADMNDVGSKVKWNLDITDALMKDGGLDVLLSREDLPDEMFEDRLHVFVRATQEKMVEEYVSRLRKEFTRHTHPTGPGPSGPPTSMIFACPPPDADLDWDPDEVITQPMCPDVRELVDMEKTRAERKTKGVCPECGDMKRESAVGVCRDHGKFLG